MISVSKKGRVVRYLGTVRRQGAARSERVAEDRRKRLVVDGRDATPCGTVARRGGEVKKERLRDPEGDANRTATGFTPRNARRSNARLPTIAHIMTKLLRRLRCQRLHHRDVLQQLRRYTMPLLQICRTVVGNPDFPIGIFPDQNLEREIDCNAGSG